MMVDKEEKVNPKLLVPIDEIPVTMQLIQRLSMLDTTPARYRDKPMDMFATALQGRELGVGPLTAINNIFLVNGSVSMHAKLMAGLVFRDGHHYRIEASDKEATITCFRWHRQSQQLLEAGVFSFTAEQADRAGLVTEDKEAWTKYPQMMLTNRVLTWAARMIYADCILGLGHDPEEINIITGDDLMVELEDGVVNEIIEGEVVDEKEQWKKYETAYEDGRDGNE